MPPRKKQNNLVIVESPSKAKTIEKYLGAGFEVMASYGHIRDLVKTHKQFKLGIDIDGGWIPFYRLTIEDKEKGKERFAEQRKKNFAEIKKKASKADIVYLAPDPDREGEAIAWHLKEALGLDDSRIQRITFNEITKKAIHEAFAQAGQINMDLVNAQEARRFLDRVVGFPLSGLLRKKVSKSARSAGRVQSVTVRMIVERELEIEAFKPEEFWKITALLAPKGTVPKLKQPILAKAKAPKAKAPKAAAPTAGAPKTRGKRGAAPAAEDPAADGADAKDGEGASTEPRPEIPEGSYLAELSDWKGAKFKADNTTTANGIVTALRKATYTVTKIEQKDRNEKPDAPFTTSTLQQQAYRRLHMSSKDTMRNAQRLYEGVELGSEGRVALITYMRTDSTRIAKEAQDACRDFIKRNYGPPYLPATAPKYASGKSAQEAHEAIRPTDLAYTPDSVAPFLDKRAHGLYTLIYNRFVASQMTPAVFAVTNVEITAGDGLFKAQGKVMKFDGYRRVLPPAGKSEDALLPPLKEKQVQDLLDLHGSQHFTQPPPRYNEGSLVKAMEKEGIGRPSTYSSIISKIQDVGYVEQRERRFYATELGKQVTEQLIKFFPRILDLKFTSRMEEELDEIAENKLQRNDVLNQFWGTFQKEYETADVGMKSVQETGENCPQCQKPLMKRFARGTGRQFIGCSGYPDCQYTKPGVGEEGSAPEPTDQKCPTCGKLMLKKSGFKGPYLGCSDPSCKTKMNFDAEGKPVLASQPTDFKCEKCGKEMVMRQSRRGPFLGCTGYPKCKNTKDLDAEGKPVKKVDLGIKCEKCNEPMAIKRGPGGPFLGCTGYPKCRSTKKMTDELREQLKDFLPAQQPKSAAPKIEVQEACPKCGSTMILRQGRSGHFLGCKSYPKCKGTKEISPDAVEQILATVDTSK